MYSVSYSWPARTSPLDTVRLGLQEEGLDTVDANRALGLPDDCREYSSVRNILSDLDIKSIRLMVGSAPKSEPLVQDVHEQLPGIPVIMPFHCRLSLFESMCSLS